MSKQAAPYGSWASPVSAELLTRANVGISEVQLAEDCSYWLESRPLERGRSTVVKLGNDGKRIDLLPAPLNARSRVNEYGGGSYCIHAGQLYFVHYDDQRIYRIDIAEAEKGQAKPEALTPEGPWRYGDLVVDPARKRLLAVCEDHGLNGAVSEEEDTAIAAIPLSGGEPRVLLSGRDFYASPAISPDGRHIAWLSWNHPNMPWDGCECWLGEIDAKGEIVRQQPVAGGKSESIVQPQWSPDRELYLISDRSGWWNIYRLAAEDLDCEMIHGECLQPVCPSEMEFASPQWVFGQSSYCFLSSKTILCCYASEGLWQLATIDLGSGALNTLNTGLTDLAYLRSDCGKAAFIGAAGRQFPALYSLDSESGSIDKQVDSGSVPVDPDFIAEAQSIRFPLSQSDSPGHVFFYPPLNRDFEGPKDERPPLLVLCHGGPTASTRNSLNLKIQYWTSRGFAVADVNYGGSTGFGRDYRERLSGQWGVVDVQDAVDCVRFLVDEGLVDGDRVAIRGSSAGGFTVLAALTFHDVFRAGASLYGIGDLEALAADTHKFESRYLEKLIGPYPAARKRYEARSPIHHVERLDCPVIFLQGMQDKIVPPNQAEAMVAALDRKHIPVAYVTFEEEGHGFRQAANIRRALESELYFYSRVFGFTLAEAVEAVPIRHEERLPMGGKV